MATGRPGDGSRAILPAIQTVNGVPHTQMMDSDYKSAGESLF